MKSAEAFNSLYSGRIRRSTCVSLLGYTSLFVVVFSTSVVVLGYYVNGDQWHYRMFYHALIAAHPSEVQTLQLRYTGGAEPLFGHVMWLGANLGYEKGEFVATFNALLAVVLVRFLRLNDVRIWLIPLFLANFYFLVLLFAAERLKFAVLLTLIFAALSSRLRYFAAILAPFAHFQTLILYSSGLAAQIPRIVSRRTRLQTVWAFIVAAIVGVLLLNHFGASLQDKLAGYGSRERGFSELIGGVAALALGLVVIRDRLRLLLAMSPIMVAALVVGSARVNMMAFMLLTYLVVVERRACHPFYLTLLVYFAVKSVSFMHGVFALGDGFAELK